MALGPIAILSVVIFHAFPSLVPGGFTGVDIFFVISGFLISTIIFTSLERDRFSLVQFYVRRVRRIFPALIVVLVTTLFLGRLLLLGDEFDQLAKHIAAGAAFVQNLVLWRESGYFDNAADTKPLLHLWSLAVEEQFYIFWPVLLVSVWKRSWNFLKVTVIVGLLSFAASLYLMHRNPIAAFFLPVSRFWELMIGGALAYIVKHRASMLERHKAAQSLFGIALIIAGFAFISNRRDFPGEWALLPTVGAFFVISAGPTAWLNDKLLSSKLLVSLGLISYPLYLWHWVLLSMLRIVKAGSADAYYTTGAVLLSVMLAWLTYLFVEKPLRWGGHAIPKVLALSLGIVMCGTIGFALYKHEVRNTPMFFYNYAANVEANLLVQKHHDMTTYLTQVEDERQVAIRSPLCHFNMPNQSAEEFIQLGASACRSLVPGRKNILIIGDSHAADLYAALSVAYKDYNFLQITGASCTPVLSVHRPGTSCYKLVDYAVTFASKTKVDGVMVAARWSDGYGDIGSSIERIRRINPNIYIIGPPAEFLADAFRVIVRSDEEFSKRRYLDQNKFLVNDWLRKYAESNNLHFVDRISLYCGENLNCPIVLKDGDLMIMDYGHLSRQGTEFLGQKMWERNVLREIQ